MQFLVVDQEIEVLPELICRQVSETLACLERQFKSCTADMVEQDEQVVRVYQRLLRGSGEKVFRMMCQELVKRAGRGDQHCHGGVISALLDSAMANALFAIGIVAVTATLELRYRAPTVTGRFAMVRAWIESDNAYPLYLQRAELIQDGKVMVEAKAKFLVREAV